MKYLSFMPEMAMAYARGDKRVTRRVIKHLFDDKKQCEHSHVIHSPSGEPFLARHCDHGSESTPCPHGKEGDTVGLITTWSVDKKYDHLRPLDFPKLPMTPVIWSYFQGVQKPERHGKLRRGRTLSLLLRDQMPRAKLVSIDAERAQDINEEESMLEGIMVLPMQDRGDPSAWYESAPGQNQARSAKQSFRGLWNDINEKRGYGWNENPWVWREELEGVK